jgi:hypothetical protein
VILLTLGVLVVWFVAGLAKACSRADRGSETAFRALVLRGFARRRGDRRSSDRRVQIMPVPHDHRVTDRRVAHRRSDPTVVDRRSGEQLLLPLRQDWERFPARASEGPDSPRAPEPD